MAHFDVISTEVFEESEVISTRVSSPTMSVSWTMINTVAKTSVNRLVLPPESGAENLWSAIRETAENLHRGVEESTQTPGASAHHLAHPAAPTATGERWPGAEEENLASPLPESAADHPVELVDHELRYLAGSSDADGERGVLTPITASNLNVTEMPEASVAEKSPPSRTPAAFEVFVSNDGENAEAKSDCSGRDYGGNVCVSFLTSTTYPSLLTPNGRKPDALSAPELMTAPAIPTLARGYDIRRTPGDEEQPVASDQPAVAEGRRSPARRDARGGTAQPQASATTCDAADRPSAPSRGQALHEGSHLVPVIEKPPQLTHAVEVLQRVKAALSLWRLERSLEEHVPQTNSNAPAAAIDDSDRSQISLLMDLTVALEAQLQGLYSRAPSLRLSDGNRLSRSGHTGSLQSAQISADCGAGAAARHGSSPQKSAAAFHDERRLHFANLEGVDNARARKNPSDAAFSFMRHSFVKGCVLTEDVEEEALIASPSPPPRRLSRGEQCC